MLLRLPRVQAFPPDHPVPDGDLADYVAPQGMLFGDRAKYLMLLCGLTFAVMLIVQQGSIFWGLMIWSQSGVNSA
ncbi:MAG: hypothetical protein U0412_11930 [Nitrospira sp.]